MRFACSPVARTILALLSAGAFSGKNGSGAFALHGEPGFTGSGPIEVVMELARVVGQVVATVRSKGLPHNSLLLVDMLDHEGNSTGRREVALDTIGAGEGEWVILVRGSAASRVCSPETPLDLAVVGIVDQVSSRAGTMYSKN